MTTTISLVIPDLTDNTIAFANAASWNNYWTDISANVTFDPIVLSTAYTSSPFSTALKPHSITVDDNVYILPTLDQFNSLKTELQTLNSHYQGLLTTLRTNGLIANP